MRSPELVQVAGLELEPGVELEVLWDQTVYEDGVFGNFLVEMKKVSHHGVSSSMLALPFEQLDLELEPSFQTELLNR
jgi:hypothetical protein